MIRFVALRLWRNFQWLGRPMLRHGVFLLFMVVLFFTTYTIVGEPHTKHFDFYVQQFFMDMYVLCGIFCILPRRLSLTVKYSFYALSYIVCFTEAFLYRRFYLAYSPTMLNLALETNGGETSEFLDSCLQSPKFTEVLIVYGSILFANVVLGRWGHLWYTYLYQHLLRSRGNRVRNMTARFMRSLLFPTPSLLLIVTTLIPWAGEKAKMVDFLRIRETIHAEKITGNVFYSPLYRIIYSAKFLHVVRLDTERLITRMETLNSIPGAMDLDTVAEQTACPNIVLVIGESYNKHHASCYGYPLPTTPVADRLARKGSLTVFTDAVSPWNVTSNSFKAFLSTHSTDQPGSWTDGVLFPALFKKKGYKVAFITNQLYKSNRQNRSDFNGSFFLNDPRLDSLCFDFRNSRHFKHDGSLLQELARYKASDKNLIIVHFMGQHVLYKERCPDSERVFTLADIDRPDLSEDQRQIVADYDNATRYNDKTFGRVLDFFQNKDAVVIYFADHGDEVYDGDIGMFGRNHTADLTPAVLRGEFEVPLMIWTSPKFRRQHPATVQAIRAAADRPFATDDLPHLLQGISGIKTAFYDAHRDLLSPTFTPRKRPIKGIANYDDIIKK